MIPIRSLPSLLKEAATEWSDDKASRLGAALAYYSIFSLGPLLLLLTVVAGIVFGEEAASGELAGRLEQAVGPRGAEALQGLVASASKPRSGIIASVVGVLLVVFAATNIVIQLKDALNTIWDVPRADGGGVRGLAKRYAGAVLAMLGVGVLVVASMALSTAIGAAAKFAEGALPVPGAALQALDFAVSFALLTALFAGMYKWLPDTHVAWNDVWLGGAVTSLLFVLGKIGIGLYLGMSSTASAYGAAGSLVVLLVWIYYSAQIVFFGAELTEVYSRRFGSRRGARDRRARPGPASFPRPSPAT